MPTAHGVKMDDPFTERIKYPEAIPISGWYSMAKMVQDSDETKIRDVKEDIDTLLVFAGLFSAVLSAFLVGTYQALQPDSQQQIISLLQVISSQNYTFSAGMLNVTSSAAISPPFHAPLWALRVNGLWFASLILSLATGSVGMLVKSWLREYLAIGHLSPQWRLRTRQYRYPALQQWKVFEIAAALTLLLQLALGLFFVGLCFFTAEIDSQLQFTSVSLVSAWAFFLLLTTLAPAFSPRCPFKILFLRGTLKWARQWVRPLALLIRQATSKFVKNALDIRRWNSIHTLCTNMRNRAADFITFPSIQRDRLCDEEQDAITSGQEDSDILLATDAMMLDDGLLSTILDVLQQSRPHPTVVVDFLLQIIANRIPSRKRETCESEQLTTTIDLSMLSRHTYVTIMEVVAQVLQGKGSILLKDDSPVWMKNAMLLLMSSSPYPLPDSAQLALAACIEIHEVDSPAGRALGELLYASGEDSWSLQTISQILLSLLSHERPLVKLDAVFELFHSLLGNVAAPRNGHLIDTVLYNCSPDLRRKSRSILSALWPILVHVVDVAESTEDIPFARPEVCFYFVLALARRLDRLEESVHIFRTWWGRRSNTHWAMSSFSALGPQCRVVVNASSVLATFRQAFMNAGSPREQFKLLRRSAELCSKYAEGSYTSCVDLDIVWLCAAHIDLYDLYEQKCLRPSRLGVERRVDPRVQDAWALLWGTMHEALRKYWDTNGWAEPQPHYPFPHANNVPQTTAEETFAEDCRLALHCLQRMPALDLAAANVESSRSDTDGADPYEGLYSVIPLELYLTLRLFCAGEKAEGIWYIRQPPPKSELAASTPPSSVVEQVEEDAHDSRWCWCQVCEEFAFNQTPGVT